MTSEKIFYAILAVVFAIIGLVAYQITQQAPFGIGFGFMSFLALAKTLELKDWFD